MTPRELCKLCKKQEDMGLSRVVLTMPRPKSRRLGTFRKNVRTPFGYGQVMSYHKNSDRLVFAIEINKIYNYFLKVI